MIRTLTPNPSIDRTLTLERLAVGLVNRSSSVRQDPGGKGVNVSRAIALHGGTTCAVMPLGGPEGEMLRRLLTGAGVDVAASAIDGATRINTALVEADGVTTKINEAGPRLDAHDVEALLEACCSPATPGCWIVGAGSVPRGVADDFYARLVTRGHNAGAYVAIDSSGAPFLAALEARPDLVKPNHHELGEALGRTLHTLGDVVTGARELTAAGIATVVVSLGGSGALAVTGDQVLHAAATPVRPRSTVGAGDALLAGFLLARDRGGSVRDALELGIRFGSAAVRLDGSLMPGPGDITDITVTFHSTPDLDAPVEE